MAGSWLRRWTLRRERYHETQATSFLHDVTRFHSLLECERMRADRSGTRFSLAVFTFAASDEGRHRLRLFAEQLQPRMRATDHPGWMDEHRIGVILWDTREVGAWKFIDSVADVSPSSKPDRCEVFIYPSYEAPARPEDGSCGSERTETRQLMKSLAEEAGEPRPAKPMEALFVRQLPAWKRGLDIIASAGGLVVLSPLLMAVALLVKLTSRGPVLFRQMRDGLGGKQFEIFKFRTMRIDAEELKAKLREQSEQDGPAFKMKNDPRITPIGRWLRKSCIDELPQLWNVLKGDMTLVGPRPLDVKESQYIDGWKRRRLEVTPGLTCIWQVHGKSRVPFIEWMRMDLRYMRARSFARDLKLVLETLVSVVLHRASH